MSKDMIEHDFDSINEFLSENSTLKPTMTLTIKEYREARTKKLKIKDIHTKTDNVAVVLLKNKFGLNCNEVKSMIEDSNRVKAATNVIGHILEYYLSVRLSQYGWIWCAGKIVKSTDFIKKNNDGTWRMLQVKNRENTENSSSSKVREGTLIEKWYRFNSKTGKTMWDKFPDDAAKNILSENDFEKFVHSYFLK